MPCVAAPARLSGSTPPSGAVAARSRLLTALKHPGVILWVVEPVCELCGRIGVALTRHHLVPRMRIGKNQKRKNRRYDSGEALQQIAMLCYACHRHIHVVLTEKELEASYRTVESLLAHPEIARFVEWIRYKPAGFTTRSRRAVP